MSGRIDKFSLNLLTSNHYDILCITETWLHDLIDNSLFQINDYHLFRCDRSIFSSNKEGGGGVLVLVHKSINVNKLSLSTNSCDNIMVEIKLSDENVLLIGNVYFPPNCDYEVYEEYLNAVQELISNSKFKDIKLIILGDFNITKYNWVNNNYHCTAIGRNPSHIINRIVLLLNSFCNTNSLRQFSSIKNNYDNILDLVFSNIDNIQVNESIDPLLENSVFHKAFEFDILINNYKYISDNYKIFNFNIADYDSINKELCSIKWDEIIDFESDINLIVSKFNDIINNIVYKFVPISRICDSTPKWFSLRLRKNLKLKIIFHKLYKKYKKSKFYYDQFKYYRRICKNLISKDFKNYVKKIELSLKLKPKNFYNYINNTSKTNNCFPNTMHLDGNIGSCNQEIANLFALKFSSVYKSKDDINLDLSHISIDNSLNSITIVEKDLISAFGELNANSSPGFDKIHPKFVKNSHKYLVYPLLKIYNLSLSQGIFPELWKISLISPIFKNGDKSSIDNYRPVAIQSVFCKIFQNIICKYLTENLSKFIIAEQHGFLSKRSTISNLFIYIESISKSLINNHIVDSIYTDFSKAFDIVNTSLLINKLKAYGINGTLINWLESHLSNRFQIVKFKGSFSNPFPVTSGTGQGTHLGPLLFIIFINDIKSVIQHSQFLLFADDLKIFKTITEISDKVSLQSDINSVTEWVQNNGLSFNIDKCCSMTFSKNGRVVHDYFISGTKINNVNNVKDLGIIIDNKLSFSNHLQYIKTKANKTLYFLKFNSKHFKDFDAFRTLYYSYLFPILSYGSVIWNVLNKQQIYELDKIVHRYLRFVAYHTNFHFDILSHDYSAISRKLGIPNLTSVFERYDLLFLYKLFNNYIDCKAINEFFLLNIPGKLLRKTRMFKCDRIKNNKFSKLLISNRLSNLSNKTDWMDFTMSFNKFISLSKSKIFIYK